MAPNLKKNQLKQSKIEAEESDEEHSHDSDEEQQEEDAETDEGVGEEAASDEAEDIHEFDINASDTSSSDGLDDLDEDDDDDTDDDDEEEEEDVKVPSKEERIRTKIQERYDQFRGKRLYVRFPEKLPETEDKLQEKTKALSPLIKQVHRPRQKHARFCLVEFDSQAERDTALESIRQAIKKSTDEKFKKIVIDIPRTESNDFVETLKEKKLKTLEKKVANRKLKKIGVVAGKAKKFTSTLVVTNLPRRTSALEVRTAYPKAIDVRIKRNKAAVTFPTTFEARAAHKQPPTLNGIQLKARFDKMKARKRKPQVKKEKPANETAEETVTKSQKRALPKEEPPAAAETATTNKRIKKTKKVESTEIKAKPQKKQKLQKV